MSKIVFVLGLCFASLPATAESLRLEFVEDNSLKAYSDYWRNFDDYEKHKFLDRKGQHFEAWDRLKTEWNIKERSLTEAQLADLKGAAKRYERQLKEHPTAGSTPYARMNLAQVYHQIGIHQYSQKASEPYKRQALAVLADLNKNQPGFALNDEVLYLRATILESLESQESAFNVWQSLARNGKDSIYTVHAHIALGDASFEKEKAELALRSYEKASEILGRISSEDSAYEKIRVDYRRAWAAYRSADLDQSIAASQNLLKPELDFKRISLQKRMTQDACDLIGDALFEQNEINQTKDYLQRDLLRPFASNIGLRILGRFASNPSPTQTTDLGEFLLEQYPSSKESPEIATILADTYRATQNEQKYIATLERLSLMLPKSSIWRVQHRNEPTVIAAMEAKALNANQLLAGKFYENGMIQRSQSNFETARTYYDALLRFDPGNSEAETWDLRRANSLYFAHHYEEADKAYEAFKKRPNVQSTNLEVAFYQQALSREKIWRNSLSQFNEGEARPDSSSMAKLKSFQDGISAFADRFPNQSTVVDLLLLAANANRDLKQDATAESLWNRALLSSPNPTQRTLAIRGLVQTRVKRGKAEDTLSLARNYLNLEDFDQLGISFQRELVNVVASSAKEYAASLNARGKILEAGQLLLAVAKEFPKVPDRDNLYRDGAYYMALSGHWKDSEKAANEYLAEQNAGGNTDDLLYLKARSLEYQLRFKKAAEAHMDLVERFPRFAKASQSAQRSEMLAAAEDDYQLAGRAAALVSNYQKSQDEKTNSLLRSAEYYAKARAWPDSLKILARAERETKSPNARMQAQLQTAKIWNAQGQGDKALVSYRKLASEAESQRDDLDKDLYRKIVSESNYLLGEALEKDFEREASIASRIDFKGSKLEKSLAFYNKAISADDAEWSSRARFKAAQLAETMSHSIQSILAKSEGKVDHNLGEQAKRWLQVSQQYHTQNLMARQKDPYRFKDVVWIERSALKASGLQPQVEPAARNLPSALDTTQPYQWSH